MPRRRTWGFAGDTRRELDLFAPFRAADETCVLLHVAGDAPQHRGMCRHDRGATRPVGKRMHCAGQGRLKWHQTVRRIHGFAVHGLFLPLLSVLVDAILPSPSVSNDSFRYPTPTPFMAFRALRRQLQTRTTHHGVMPPPPPPFRASGDHIGPDHGGGNQGGGGCGGQAGPFCTGSPSAGVELPRSACPGPPAPPPPPTNLLRDQLGRQPMVHSGC